MPYQFFFVGLHGLMPSTATRFVAPFAAVPTAEPERRLGDRGFPERFVLRHPTSSQAVTGSPRTCPVRIPCLDVVLQRSLPVVEAAGSAGGTSALSASTPSARAHRCQGSPLPRRPAGGGLPALTPAPRALQSGNCPTMPAPDLTRPAEPVRAGRSATGDHRRPEDGRSGTSSREGGEHRTYHRARTTVTGSATAKPRPRRPSRPSQSQRPRTAGQAGTRRTDIGNTMECERTSNESAGHERIRAATRSRSGARAQHTRAGS